MTLQHDQEQIRSLLSRMNEAWLKGYTERLKECFHDDVVIRGPDLQEMGRGREPCVKSYGDFIRLATVREFKASEPAMDLFDNMAVAICPWEISYRMNDQEHNESGHDLLVLTCQKGKWQVARRTVLSSAQR